MGEILLKLGFALAIGTIIGAEREYKNKSAGLRTLILICLGSTLFTMISYTLGAESETGRIASNIVTGIGFLGAGAIMREGLTVTGLTTASSRSEEHTSELQSLMRISYAVFCLKKKKKRQ